MCEYKFYNDDNYDIYNDDYDYSPENTVKIEINANIEQIEQFRKVRFWPPIDFLLQLKWFGRYYPYSVKFRKIKKWLGKKYPKRIPENEKQFNVWKQNVWPNRLFWTDSDLTYYHTKKDFLTGRMLNSWNHPKNNMFKKVLAGGFTFLEILNSTYFLMENPTFLEMEDYDEDGLKYKPAEVTETRLTLNHFNFFNNHYMGLYLCKNLFLKEIVKAFMLDLTYYKTYIESFNLVSLAKLNILEVISNFDDYKYEDDCVRQRFRKKMKTEWWDSIYRYSLISKFKYTKHNKHRLWFITAIRRPPIIDNEDYIIQLKKFLELKRLLSFSNNIFFNFITYEVSLKIEMDVVPTFFNYDFFSKAKLFFKSKKNLKKKIKKDMVPSVLNSLYYFYIDFFRKKKIFNPSKHILDYKDFNLKMPYFMFIMYTLHAVSYKRFSYNFYIRGELYFQEYFRKMHYFIWVNSDLLNFKPYCQSYKFFLINNFRGFLEAHKFNNNFIFYSSQSDHFNPVYKWQSLDYKTSDFIYKGLLNNRYVRTFMDLKKNIKLYCYIFSLFFRIESNNFFLQQGYYYFMKTGIVASFINAFKFGFFKFSDIDDLVETVYQPYEISLLMQYNEQTIMQYNLNKIAIDSNFINYYFLKDFFNYNNKLNYKKYFNLTHMYENIWKVILMFIDPFIFKFFFKRSGYPNKIRRLKRLSEYVYSTLVMYNLKSNPYQFNINIPKFNLLMHYFNWRIEGSYYVTTFNHHKNPHQAFYSDQISNINVLINKVYKDRFKNLKSHFNYLLNISDIHDDEALSDKYFYMYYMNILKSRYFDFLYNNSDYLLLLFFLNINEYIKLIKNGKDDYNQKSFFYDFIYRYYIYNTWIRRDFYKNWFSDWSKRILWIYKSHKFKEGIYFYKDKAQKKRVFF